MKILIFDFEITGHHPEYIKHLVEYIQQTEDKSKEYFFVVHPEFCDRYPDIVDNEVGSGINFISITNSELNDLTTLKTNHSHTTIKYFKLHDLLISYANRIEPDRCILMYFNYFIRPMIFHRTKFDIYGIYFSPFFRVYIENGFSSKVSYLKGMILTFLYTRNSSIKKIFILNDQTVVSELNRRVKKNIFNYLPDPIPEIKKEDNFNIRKVYNISQSKKILLHFGSLRDSKGTLELIQSLNLLSSSSSSRCCLLIVGKPRNNMFEKQIKDNISKVKQVQIVYINHFVSNSKMKSFFSQCDIVLMPYKDFLASSGVIGHAIAANKPVISNRNGLIGDIIRNYWKGELIDIVEPKTIATAIDKSIFSVYPYVSNSKYLKEHTSTNFSRLLVE